MPAHAARHRLTRGADASNRPCRYGRRGRRDEYEAWAQTAASIEGLICAPSRATKSPVIAHQPEGEIVMHTTRTLIAVAAGLALNIAGIGTGFASTGDDSAELRVVVRYANSELTSGEGVWRVKQRILSAVDQVCPTVESRDPERRAKAETCRAQALAGAVAQVKSPELAAVLAVGRHQG